MSGHILALSENVTRKRVVYQNRYGLNIVGELYYTKNLNLKEKHAALIVGAPYGGVKEQGPCVYGNALAQRGFVVLTFDQSFMGESGGFPRHVSSPDIFVDELQRRCGLLGPATLCRSGENRRYWNLRFWWICAVRRPV